MSCHVMSCNVCMCTYIYFRASALSGRAGGLGGDRWRIGSAIGVVARTRTRIRRRTRRRHKKRQKNKNNDNDSSSNSMLLLRCCSCLLCIVASPSCGYILMRLERKQKTSLHKQGFRRASVRACQKKQLLVVKERRTMPNMQAMFCFLKHHRFLRGFGDL